MNIPMEKLKAIGEIVQMLHNSSLLWVYIPLSASIRYFYPMNFRCFFVGFSMLKFTF